MQNSALRFRLALAAVLILSLACPAFAQPTIVQPPGDIPPVTATPGRLTNLSVRAFAGTDAQTLSLGFVLAGEPEKPMLIRAIGPTLASFGVAGVLADPRLQLLSGRTLLRSNDDWAVGVGSGNSLAAAVGNVFHVAGAFPLDVAAKDAAIVRSSAAGSYAAQVVAGGTGGIVLAELYDTMPAAGACLVNASARAQVGTGDAIVIAGFVIAGNTPVRVLIRGIGPGLAAFNVTGWLANPRLDLFRDGALIASNDDWGVPDAGGAGAATLATAFTQVGAFPLSDPASRDAALLVTLAPGAYTAQLTGVGGTTGVGLVEIYEVP